eukprot:scaffold1447_cov115-Isochrysis_galbana.AAC.7
MPAVRKAWPGGRRCHRRSLGHAIIPALSSRLCSQRGLVSSLCPRSYRPRSAPAGAVGPPSLPSTQKTCFWFSMEQTPADARAAPSAPAPNDIVMDIHSSPKRPRDPAQDNKVSQRVTPSAPAKLKIQIVTTEYLIPAQGLQSYDTDP